MIVTLGKRKRVDFTFLGQHWLSHSTHFFGRTYPCLVHDCPGCTEQLARPQFYGCVSLSQDPTVPRVIEVPSSISSLTSHVLDERDAASMRGYSFCFERDSPRAPWRLMDYSPAGPCLPDLGDAYVSNEIARLFGLAGGDEPTCFDELVQASMLMIKARMTRAMRQLF